MKIIETTGVTVALAKWIINDFSGLYLLSIKPSEQIQDKKSKQALPTCLLLPLGEIHELSNNGLNINFVSKTVRITSRRESS